MKLGPIVLAKKSLVAKKNSIKKKPSTLYKDDRKDALRVWEESTSLTLHRLKGATVKDFALRRKSCVSYLRT